MVSGWRVRLRRPEARRPREVPPRYRVKERPPSNRKKWLGWLLPLLVLGGVPSFFWVKGYGVLEARGIVKGHVVDVGTPMEGVLDMVLVSMGDRVEAGQEVARIDTRELSARVRGREGEVLEARARRDLLKNEWSRCDRLARQGYESLAVVDAARQSYMASEGALKSAEAALDAARARLNLAVVKAPISGVVLWDPLQPGTVVDRDDPVMSILDDEALWIVAYVPEDTRSQIRPGQKVTIEVEGIPDQTLEGHVAFLFKGVRFRPKGLRTYDMPAETFQPVQIIPENPDLLKGHAGYGMRAAVKIHLE